MNFFLLLLPLLHSVAAVRPTPPTTRNDTHALTVFRLSVDSHSLLLPNWTGPDACSSSWLGVGCSSPSSRVRRITSLSLPSLDLRGPLSALPPSLSALRLLDLHDNRLNSTLSSLSPSSFPNLRLLYLSRNDLSGPIPDSLPPCLVRIDLSDNSLAGPIPSSLTNVSALLTLRLQNNQLSGGVPAFAPSLGELDLSNNELAGDVPVDALARFGAASFLGNAALCGPYPLPNCTSDVLNPGTRPGGVDITVPSNPSSPGDGNADVPRKKNGLGPGPIVAIVLANAVALVAVSFMVAYCCSRDKGLHDSGETGKRNSYGSERRVYANGGGDSDETSGTDKSRLVFFERKKGFELEDLLRASAEMLGKGSLGTVYKAVLDDGCTVAVKRLKDANPCGRKEFEQYMDLIGKLRHPNVAKLRAYYYAREEKLLVYDYLPNGSLHCLLHGYGDRTFLSKPPAIDFSHSFNHLTVECVSKLVLGNRGPGRIPLDWTTRISLVLGAARGLAWIHEEYNTENIPHGNVKSTNVLLDKNGVACISDFGLSLLLNPTHAIARLGGYRAPEQSETKRLSQKADVYSFGVMLLEVLTGRTPAAQPSPTWSRIEEDEQGVDLPRWVRSVVKEEWTAEVFDQELLRYKNIEEELVSMLHVGLACVLPLPEKRPLMTEVVKMIEDIRVEQSPLGEECDESRNSLSPSLATTEDGMA